MKDWVKIIELPKHDVLVERKTDYKEEEAEFKLDITLRIKDGAYTLTTTFYTEADQIEQFNSIDDECAMSFIRSLT